YAHLSVYDQLVDGLVDYAERIQLGPKLDEATGMGPMIDEKALARMSRVVDEAVAGGAKVLTGGEPEGASFRPTFLSDVSEEAAAFKDETYGPITVLASYTDLDRAIEGVNRTEYGLQSAVFTRDIATAFTVAARIRAGG